MINFGLRRGRKLNSKEVAQKFNEMKKDLTISCTELEMNEFLLCGLLFKSKDKYFTMNGKEMKVDLIKTKTHTMNIDLRNIIYTCEDLVKDSKIKKVYCLSDKSYNEYKNDGLIVTKNNIEYYRLFENDMWLIHKI